MLDTVTRTKPWSSDDQIPAPKQPRRLPGGLSPDAVVHVLSSVHAPEPHAILTTCSAAGLRISEAIPWRPTDIDSHRMGIRIELGKGLNDRDVMLSPTLLDVWRDWWRLSRPPLWLFPGDPPDHPIGRGAVRRECRQARRRSRIPKPLTPHALRSVSA